MVIIKKERINDLRFCIERNTFNAKRFISSLLPINIGSVCVSGS